MLEHEVDGPVHLLRLAHGKVNAMDIELVAAVTARVGELAGQAGAVVLTGTGAVFSAGVDLRRVVDGGTEYGERFLPALADMFDTVFGAPVPIVAAINGWAIAGGCVLAVACDRRILSAETQIGATELQVGVPFPVSALEVLRHGCGVHADEVVLGAALHAGPEAVRLGLAHEIVDNDRVVPRALEVAHALAAVAPAAYRHAKHQLRAPVLARIAAERPRADAEVIAGWASPATLDRLRAQIARMSRRT